MKSEAEDTNPVEPLGSVNFSDGGLQELTTAAAGTIQEAGKQELTTAAADTIPAQELTTAEVPELTFGVKIKLPTGQIANFLSFGNPEVEKFFCDVVNNIDIKTPHSFPLAVGLVPVSSSCESKCPTKHVLFAGALCEE